MLRGRTGRSCASWNRLGYVFLLSSVGDAIVNRCWYKRHPIQDKRSYEAGCSESFRSPPRPPYVHSLPSRWLMIPWITVVNNRRDIRARLYILWAHSKGLEPFSYLPLEVISLIFVFQGHPQWLASTFSRPQYLSQTDDRTLSVDQKAGNLSFIIEYNIMAKISNESIFISLVLCLTKQKQITKNK